MSLAALIRKMAELGASAEAIACAVEAVEAVESKDAERRAKRASEKARQRANKAATVARQSADNDATVGDMSPDTLPEVSPKDNISNPLPNPSQSPAISARDALRMACLEIVGTEPVALAQDFHEIEALASEGVTSDDVLNGMRAAMAEKSFRPRAWSKLVGWCRCAAKDRLAAAPKAVGAAPQSRAGPPQKRSAVSGAMEILRQKYATGSDVSGAESSDASPAVREPPTLDLEAVR